MTVKESDVRMKVNIVDGQFVPVADVIKFLSVLDTVCTSETDESGLVVFEYDDGQQIKTDIRGAIRAFCSYMTSSLEVYHRR